MMRLHLDRLHFYFPFALLALAVTAIPENARATSFSFNSLGQTYSEDFNGFRGTEVTLPDYFSITAESSGFYQGEFNSTSNSPGDFTGIMAATSDGSDYSLAWRESTGSASLDDARILFNFTNNTGQAISAFQVSYDVEAWVNGRRDNQIRFKYDVYEDSVASQAAEGRDAFETDIFATVNPNFTAIAANGDQFVLDGKGVDGLGVPNQVTVSGLVDLTTLLINESDASLGTFGALQPGQTAYFRWQKSNADFTAGNRSALAIDNLSITAVPEPTALGLLLLGMGCLAGTRRRASFCANQAD